MSLTRRGFLGLLTTAAAGVAIAPELADLLKPRPTIFLPPKGGWIKPYEFNKIRGVEFHKNAFMSVDGLWIFGETTTEIYTWDHLGGVQWPKELIDRVVTRRL